MEIALVFVSGWGERYKLIRKQVKECFQLGCVECGKCNLLLWNLRKSLSCKKLKFLGWNWRGTLENIFQKKITSIFNNVLAENAENVMVFSCTETSPLKEVDGPVIN